MSSVGRDDVERDGDEIDDPLSGDPASKPTVTPAARSLETEAARIRRQVRQINDRVNERSGRDLFAAVAMSILLIAAVIASLLIDKRWFIVFGVAMVALLVVELSTAMRKVGRRVPRVPSAIVAVVTVPVAFFYGPAWQWGALLIGTVFVLVWRLVQAAFESPRPSKQQLMIDASSSLFVQLYATFLGSFISMLAGQPEGEYWVLTFIIVVVCVDTGAYVTGMRYGRTKMAPKISPGKTWEGLIGGAGAAIIAAVLACVFVLDIPWWFGLIMGPALTLTATAGDLTESMIKRSLGIKDMSNWLPGHGGFFDRFDSMLPSGAMTFALYVWAAPFI